MVEFPHESPSRPRANSEDILDESAWNAAADFNRLKFDEKLKALWKEKFAQNPPAFFDDLHLSESLSVSERLVLLARASLHITVTPSMVATYFHHFPADKTAVAALIIEHQGVAEDGITHTLFGLVWHVVRDTVNVHGLRGHRRNSGQYDEIPPRRELAPRFLLSNHREGGSRLREIFGDAAIAYEQAASKADELAMHGYEPLETGAVFANQAYGELSEDRKAQFLRACLEDMQFALVFDETFNSAFTEKSVADRNERKRGYKYARYDPGHSMLFDTQQSGAVYDLPDDVFNRQMSNTHAIGGDIEEYAHHKLLLAILKEFPHVHAEQDENVDLLVEFWIKNRNPLFANAVVAALKSQHAERAAQKLLEAARLIPANRSSLIYILRRVDSKAILKHMPEIGQLLKDEDTPERFMLETCAQLRREGALDPEEIAGSKFISIPGGAFHGQLQETASHMLAIQKQRYGREGANYSEPVLHDLDEALMQKLFNADNHSRFYLYYFQSELVGFFRFDDEYDAQGNVVRKHLASVMGNPRFRKGGLVETLLEKMLIAEAAVPIRAECDPGAGITQKYHEWGFVARSSGTFHDLPIFNIEFDREVNRSLRTSAINGLSQEDIIRRVHAHHSENEVYVETKNPREISDKLDELQAGGFAMTRYFSRTEADRSRARNYYAVFERVGENDNGRATGA